MAKELRLHENSIITEDDLAQGQPAMRAFVLAGLMEVWNHCAVHVRGEVDRVDPRMVELGLRTLKEMAAQFRLGAQQAVTVSEDPRSPREVAMAKIRADMLQLEGLQSP